VAFLLAVYTIFGTIVWAAYLNLDPSQRRLPAIEAELAPLKTIVPEDAWQAWSRHHIDLQARTKALMRTLPAGPKHLRPVDPSPAPSSMSAAKSRIVAPRPSLKPLDVVATSASRIRLRELRPAQGPPAPSLKPFEKTAQPESVSFWSEVFALFEASSSPTVASDDNERDRDSDTSERTAGIGGDHASNNADGETDAGDASGRNPGSNTSASNDRSANSGGGAERDRRAGGDEGSGSGSNGASSGDASSGGSSSDGGDSGRGSSDREGGDGNDGDKGTDKGDKGRDKGGKGDKGGRGDKGDKGDKGGKGDK